MILALILGPMMESNLRRSLLIADGDWTIFVTGPISAVLLGLAIITLFTPIIKDRFFNSQDILETNDVKDRKVV